MLLGALFDSVVKNLLSDEMQKFEFATTKDQPLKILCLGAHSDDIEIGCGGTMLRLLSEYENAEVYWVVLGASGKRDGEAVASANKFLAECKKEKNHHKEFQGELFPL